MGKDVEAVKQLRRTGIHLADVAHESTLHAAQRGSQAVVRIAHGERQGPEESGLRPEALKRGYRLVGRDSKRHKRCLRTDADIT